MNKRDALGEWLVDRVVSLLSVVHPGLLRRDSVKMCWLATTVPAAPQIDARYRLEVLDAFQPPTGWVDVMTSAGMPVTPATWQREFGSRRGSRVFGMYEGDTLVAAAGIRPIRTHADALHLLWVGVRPEHQGRALGRALVIAAMNFSVEAGAKSVFLLTDDHRLAALSLYLDLGFQPCLASWDRTQHLRWLRIARRLHRRTSFCRRDDHRGPVAHMAE